MFQVTDNTLHTSGVTTGSPYGNDLADLQLPFQGIATEYVNLSPDNLLITTDTPSFIQSGAGNDYIIDGNKTPGDVVIDPGSGSNTVQASSNPTSHDTIIIDAESDAPLFDGILGFKAGDNVVIKGVTALAPTDITNATIGTLQGLMLTVHASGAAGPAAQIFLAGRSATGLANGHLTLSAFTPPSSMPEASSYLLLHAAV